MPVDQGAWACIDWLPWSMVCLPGAHVGCVLAGHCVRDPKIVFFGHMCARSACPTAGGAPVQVAVNTVITDVNAFLDHIVAATNMRCLTPPSALTGECGFLAANLYAKSVFGEDALVNVSIEQAPDGRLAGFIRIRRALHAARASSGVWDSGCKEPESTFREGAIVTGITKLGPDSRLRNSERCWSDLFARSHLVLLFELRVLAGAGTQWRPVSQD